MLWYFFESVNVLVFYAALQRFLTTFYGLASDSFRGRFFMSTVRVEINRNSFHFIFITRLSEINKKNSYRFLRMVKLNFGSFERFEEGLMYEILQFLFIFNFRLTAYSLYAAVSVGLQVSFNKVKFHLNSVLFRR